MCKRCAAPEFPLRVLFIAHQAWMMRSYGAQQIPTAMRNFSTTRGRMVSIPFNALSEASSMCLTYPPTTKLSPLFTAAEVCNPSTQKQKKNSALCSPSLRVNHRVCHCGTINSRVSVNPFIHQSLIPWSFSMCLYLTVSVYFVYWTLMSVICSLFLGFCINPLFTCMNFFLQWNPINMWVYIHNVPPDHA